MLPEREKLSTKLQKKIIQLEQQKQNTTNNNDSESDNEDEYDSGTTAPKRLNMDTIDSDNEEDSSNFKVPFSKGKSKLSKEKQKEIEEEEEEERTMSINQREKHVLYVLNKGTLKELLALHCIGDARAKKIIEYREEAQFTKLQDLKHVGFGSKMYGTFYEKNIEMNDD